MRQRDKVTGGQTDKKGEKVSERETRRQEVIQRDKVTGRRTEREGDKVSDRETW